MEISPFALFLKGLVGVCPRTRYILLVNPAYTNLAKTLI
jgi:hypothetical protein